MLSYVVPTINVSISESQTPTALRSYMLTCDITAPSTLALTNISYTWTKNGTVQSGQTNEHAFNSLPLSEDNAVYICQYRASSVYINNTVVRISPEHTIRITGRCIYCVSYVMIA